LNGRSVEQLGTDERAAIRNREIGFIFQSFNLIADLSVAENVELPLVYRGMTRGERRLRVAEVLERVHAGHRAKHYPMQLSGGEQQRVAVARALAVDPSILLADEPTGNLDTRNGEAVMDLLRELHEGGSTIVMVTHDARFARHAKRTVGLLDGQLVDASIACSY
jgi:putative ABC transport system ATP-binding protein